MGFTVLVGITKVAFSLRGDVARAHWSIAGPGVVLYQKNHAVPFASLMAGVPGII